MNNAVVQLKKNGMKTKKREREKESSRFCAYLFLLALH